MSILQKEKECYICKSMMDLQKHHIYMGANRKVSDKHGFTAWLCGSHHNMSDYSVHFNRDLDLKLKIDCQKEYEKTQSREEFMKLIGRNYL